MRDVLVFATGALLIFGLLRALPKLSSAKGLLSLKVHPGLAMMVTTFWAGVALTELALRMLLFQNFPDYDLHFQHEGLGYSYDRELGWFPVANSQKTLCVNGQTLFFAHNSKGFRDPEPSLDARPGIVFLGDSFVWGYRVNAEDLFTEKLRARHPEWRVFNFGVVGYGNDQEYLLLRKYFEEYRPQLVFLVFCTENDRLDNRTRSGGRRPYKPYFTVEAKGLKLHGVPVPLCDWIFCLRHPTLSKSYLARLTIQAWANFRCPKPPANEDPSIPILAAINRYVSEHGATFCVGLNGPDAEMESWLRNSGIPWVDLSTALRGEGDFHWSPEGHAFVARKIDQFLTSGKFLASEKHSRAQVKD